MHVLHVNSKQEAAVLNEWVKEGKHVFLLVFMEGCGPCNATRPEWSKLKGALKRKHQTDDKLVIADVNREAMEDVEHLGEVLGFPTLKHVSEGGNKVTLYEDSSFSLPKDRSVGSFVAWIDHEKNKQKHKGGNGRTSAKRVYARLGFQSPSSSAQQAGGRASTRKKKRSHRRRRCRRGKSRRRRR